MDCEGERRLGGWGSCEGASVGLAWSRGCSQVFEFRQQASSPWCEPSGGTFQPRMRKLSSPGWAFEGRSRLSGREQALSVGRYGQGRLHWEILTSWPQVASSWRYVEIGLLEGDRLTPGCLCFPYREYTEDGQVKTETRYSYSEYRAPTILHTCGLCP